MIHAFSDLKVQNETDETGVMTSGPGPGFPVFCPRTYALTTERYDQGKRNHQCEICDGGPAAYLLHIMPRHLDPGGACL
jgi:hypothetical protein